MSDTVSFKKIKQYRGPIFLIGHSHVGKSRIGKTISKVINCPFLDLDDLIEENTGVDIQTIFHYEEEKGFRKHESKALYSTNPKKLSIIATGAGCILAEKNRQFIIENGLVVYFSIDIEVLVDVIKVNKNRPLLNNKAPKEVLREMNKIRAPLYQECADITIQITHKNPTKDSQLVLSSIENHLENKQS